MGQDIRHTVELFGLDRIQHAHGVVLAAGDPFLDQENDSGDHDHDHRDSRCEIGVRACLADPLLVDDDGHGIVAFTQQVRSAVISERTQEYDGRAGKDGRQHQRQADLQHLLDTVVAQTFRSLAERRVHLLQRAFRVHVDVWEELQHEDQQNAAKAVNTGEFNTEFVQELRDLTVPAQHQDPGIRAQEGRGKH